MVRELEKERMSEDIGKWTKNFKLQQNGVGEII